MCLSHKIWQVIQIFNNKNKLIILDTSYKTIDDQTKSSDETKLIDTNLQNEEFKETGTGTETEA